MEPITIIKSAITVRTKPKCLIVASEVLGCAGQAELRTVLEDKGGEAEHRAPLRDLPGAGSEEEAPGNAGGRNPVCTQLDDQRGRETQEVHR